MKVRYCKTCLVPNTRPRIQFDADGICNACTYSVEKFKNIDWEERKREFHEVLDKYRSKDGKWDCVVPWSGGKDSSAIAYKLKFEFGMNPLLATFSPLILNEVGERNREAMRQLGFDHVFSRPNQKVACHLAKRFFTERGNQKVAWDAGINAFPLQVAVNYKIPLVFYAEHGESEYGGRILSKDSAKFRNITEVLENLVGDDSRNWIDDVVTEKDLNPYLYPNLKECAEVGVIAYYFGYFFKWSMFENYQFIKERIPFECAEGGRTEGTFTDFDSLDDRTDELYYYMQYIKFGFGRAVRDASRMIQNGQMTRERGLELAKVYDHEFPARNFRANLDYLSLTEEEFHSIVDKHRNMELWNKVDGKWQLRHPLE